MGSSTAQGGTRDWSWVSRRSAASNLSKRVETVQSLVAEAPLGEVHRTRLASAIGTLRELDAANKLDVKAKEWIALIEAAIAAAQKLTKSKPGFLGRLLGRKA